MPAYITEIQPTMAKLVAFLNNAGYQTTDSGDGVLNMAAEMECALDFPHVFMLGSTEDLVGQAKRLDALVKSLRPAQEFQVEVSYAPNDDVVVLSIIGLTDADIDWTKNAIGMA